MTVWLPLRNHSIEFLIVRKILRLAESVGEYDITAELNFLKKGGFILAINPYSVKRAMKTKY